MSFAPLTTSQKPVAPKLSLPPAERRPPLTFQTSNGPTTGLLETRWPPTPFLNRYSMSSCPASILRQLMMSTTKSAPSMSSAPGQISIPTHPRNTPEEAATMCGICCTYPLLGTSQKVHLWECLDGRFPDSHSPVLPPQCESGVCIKFRATLSAGTLSATRYERPLTLDLTKLAHSNDRPKQNRNADQHQPEDGEFDFRIHAISLSDEGRAVFSKRLGPKRPRILGFKSATPRQNSQVTAKASSVP